MKMLRTAIRNLPLMVVGAVSCAPLLGLEEAECDVTQDPACVSEGLQPQAGSAGALANAAGNAGAANLGGNGGLTGLGGSAGAGLAGSAGLGGAGGLAGGMGGNGGGAGSAAMPPGDLTSSPECIAYCNDIAETCTEETGYLQYRTGTVCLTYCEQFELGDPSNPVGNTLACRQNEVESALATGEFAQHCPSGGPGGNGVCGSNCEGYCSAMVPVCGSLAAYSEYADEASCLAECEAVPVLNETYNTSVEDGDSFQCRLYHVTAATFRAEAHCDHASGAIFCLVGG